MMHVDQLATVLVADNPRQAADRLLAWLVGFCHATGGAVLSVRARERGDDELVLVLSRNLSVDRAPDLRFLWASHRPALLAGRWISDQHQAMAPVVDGAHVVALLYLERPKSFHMERVAAFRLALAKAVKALLATNGAPETVMGSFLSMRPEDIMREQLVMALHQEQWCIARVARALGVTRRTIYQRMRRLRIPRELKPQDSGA